LLTFASLSAPKLSRISLSGVRREGSLAATTTAIVAGATMVRVHDVRMTVHAARVVAAAV